MKALIKKTVPFLYVFLRILLRILRESFFIIRKQWVVTKFLGSEWKRSKNFMEIYLTYGCNLNCLNCDISSRQAPANEKMSLEQIQKFIDESITAGIKWGKIRIMGGEPTLHPDILAIIKLLIRYKREYSKDTIIQLITNGYGVQVNKVLEEIPGEVEIENSKKTDERQLFDTFNIAPVDLLRYKTVDYSNGCYVTDVCGIGLTPFGYYCCGIAGGIDRILGFDLARKKIPDSGDKMTDQFNVFCRYCGHFKYPNFTNKEEMSGFWKKAYGKYKEEKPVLSRY